jgi:valyl-tRNA synthetase
MEKTYNPHEVEEKIYAEWEKGGFFKSQPNPQKKPFCVLMPPPNANGELHLGHASMLVYEDIMVRYHRMRGFESLWIPGTDHAGIQTQVVFERALLKQGKTKEDLGQDEFYRQCFNFCMKNKKTITSQIRKIGASCDWSKERFSLDENMVKDALSTFVKMHQEGLIYQGERIINWCPRCQTALSDIEVEHETKPAKLYYLKYGPLTVATVRPETKLGDTGLAVHPNDSRYKKYVGKTLKIKSVEGEIELPVIADEVVDPQFGTGVVKVTPAHDPLDFEIGQRHHLETKQVIGTDQRMTEKASQYQGKTIEETRAEIINDLKKLKLIEKIEDYQSNVSVCERCSAEIQPLVSKQWFIKMRDLSQKAIETVKDGKIKIYPERFENDFYHWMENIKDWCISRQIWWGPRLPVWHCEDCQKVTISLEKPQKCAHCSSKQLKQTTDTLDTWFLSTQWPYTALGFQSDLFKYFYPTSVMETGWDILFFWVARMIVMGLYTAKDVPFRNVYLHGLVVDKNGKKMSKSKGTGIDPLILIKKFGTDALRLSFIMGIKPGQNVRLYEQKVEKYRNFVNKLWNISRYVLENPSSKIESSVLSQEDHWIISRVNSLLLELEKNFENFRFGQAAEDLYEFMWHDFADWYLELSKDGKDHNKTLKYCLEILLKVLHPFIPFITEEIWSKLSKDKKLIVSSWPKVEKEKINPELENKFNQLRKVITTLRNAQETYSISKSQEVILSSNLKEDLTFLNESSSIISKFSKFENLKIQKTLENKIQGILLPVENVSISIQLEVSKIKKEIEKLNMEKERTEKFIFSINQKLKNKKFLEKAHPEIIQKEKDKLLSQEEKLKVISKNLSNFKSV